MHAAERRERVKRLRCRIQNSPFVWSVGRHFYIQIRRGDLARIALCATDPLSRKESEGDARFSPNLVSKVRRSTLILPRPFLLHETHVFCRFRGEKASARTLDKLTRHVMLMIRRIMLRSNSDFANLFCPAKFCQGWNFHNFQGFLTSRIYWRERRKHNILLRTVYRR